ncbi:nuclear transport factor 2 family protein [Kitasatospora sp. GAS1066B]|uniref:nuclear transport factor 2 family protein n=1 Tax=Kitasatospora sp. GAS1066B TaxID=3156271 RepID=UPI003510FE2B
MNEVSQQALDAARAFIAAANRGDVPALERALAPDVRIDMGGAVHQGRGQVLDRFFLPWVVRVAGRYQETGARPAGDAVIVLYRFRTPAGLREDLAYTYRVGGGAITEIVGRFT